MLGAQTKRQQNIQSEGPRIRQVQAGPGGKSTSPSCERPRKTIKYNKSTYRPSWRAIMEKIVYLANKLQSHPLHSVVSAHPSFWSSWWRRRKKWSEEEMRNSGPFYLAVIENPKFELWYTKQRIGVNRLLHEKYCVENGIGVDGRKASN